MNDPEDPENETSAEPQGSPEPEPATQQAPSFSPGRTPPERETDPASNAWGMACHLSTLLTYVLAFGMINVPGLIAPLILWQLLEGGHPSAVRHAKEAFNFQLNVLVLMGIGHLLNFTCCALPLGMTLLAVVHVANVVLTLVAATKAANGARWQYPFILRVLDSGR